MIDPDPFNSLRSIYPEPLRLSSIQILLRKGKGATWLLPKVGRIRVNVMDHNPESQISPCVAGENNSIQDYNPLWISELRRTNAYEVWERVTDPLLFDIVEPRCGRSCTRSP